MTNETLERLIDQVQDGSASARVSVRPLLANVLIAKVWEELDGLALFAERGLLVYFITEPVGGCVGACYWMGTNDFHVFLKEDYRGRGLMTNALRDVILPHVFQQEEHASQKATASPDSKRMLERLGFTPVDGGDADQVSISRSQCKEVSFPAAEPFTKEKKHALRRHFAVTACLMEQVRFQLESTAGTEDLRDDLEWLRDRLAGLRASDDLLEE
jgi:hypothetical protein